MAAGGGGWRGAEGRVRGAEKIDGDRPASRLGWQGGCLLSGPAPLRCPRAAPGDGSQALQRPGQRCPREVGELGNDSAEGDGTNRMVCLGGYYSFFFFSFFFPPLFYALSDRPQACQYTKLDNILRHVM